LDIDFTVGKLAAKELRHLPGKMLHRGWNCQQTLFASFVNY
jgi:hypothetical protein